MSEATGTLLIHPHPTFSDIRNYDYFQPLSVLIFVLHQYAKPLSIPRHEFRIAAVTIMLAAFYILGEVATWIVSQAPKSLIKSLLGKN